MLLEDEYAAGNEPEFIEQYRMYHKSQYHENNLYEFFSGRAVREGFLREESGVWIQITDMHIYNYDINWKTVDMAWKERYPDSEKTEWFIKRKIIQNGMEETVDYIQDTLGIKIKPKHLVDIGKTRTPRSWSKGAPLKDDEYW